ncbi:Protein SUPPRESSOR OF QUENCHING 1 [Chlorella vulgaris]
MAACSAAETLQQRALPAKTSRRNAPCISGVRQQQRKVAAPAPPLKCHRPSRLRAGPTSSATGQAGVSTAAPTTAAATVKAVLFDMDGVLCASEAISRQAATETMAELYSITVDPDDFIPFTGTGEANFLGGVARKYGAPFELESCKAKFFEIYMSRYCRPGAGIGHKGARALVEACRAAGLKTAVASSADRVKVDANLAAADIPLDLFDAIVSADAFEHLKPSPDIFLAAARELGVDPLACVVIEDAVAGVQAARAAGMRVIGVTTTLEPAVMQSAMPDWIQPDVQSITVADIKGLQSIEQQQQPQQQQQRSDSTAVAVAGGAAEPPAANGGGRGTQGWLDGMVQLPAGYRTSRRDLLKFASLGGAFGSLYVGVSRAQREPGVRRFLLRYHIPTLIQLAIIAYVASGWQYFRKSLSYASPRALLNALFPQGQLPAKSGAPESGNGRVAAFKRYIAGKCWLFNMEKRGGGQAVPEFPTGLDWFNAPPLRLSRELRGKVLVLDFWTYCCINCIHVLPDLAAIERKYSGAPVAVVGVHSAKFDNEKDSEAIRNAVLRYEISHPVVNDGNMTLWRGLGVSSWPTLAVVSPRGRVIAMLPGEGHRQDVDDILAAALEHYGEAGQLDNTPVPSALEKDKDPLLAASPLRYPGKVASDLTGAGRLFIADSTNNRIVVTDAKGRFLEAIGCGAPGLVDGGYEEAALYRPQGVAYSPKRNVLYVADTENHALREVDLTNKTVKTLAGNGVKGGDYSGGASGSSQLLNSPWDVVLDSTEQYVYVALAGQHQVWRYDTATGVAANFSGNGYERNQNSGGALTTSWAQPSGLSLAPDGQSLFVADSESSTVRRLDLATGGGQACVGGDPMFSDNLFRFGDKDGSGSDALLQHPLAVLARPDGKVIVADSYNHRLKELDPATNTIRTLAGSGTAGYRDGSGTTAQLSEPAGLAAGPGGTIIVCDTNNSRIRVWDPATQRLSTLELQGVPPPRRSPDGPPAGAAGAAVEPPPGAALVRASSDVAAASGELRLSIALPAGYHLTPGANSRFEAAVLGSTGGVQLQPGAGSLTEDSDGRAASAVVLFSRQAGSSDGSGLLRVLCKLYFCQSGDVCLFQEVCFDVPLAAAASDAAPAVVPLSFALSARAPVVTLPGL